MAKFYYFDVIIDCDFDNRVRVGLFPGLELAQKAFVDYCKKNASKHRSISSLYGATYAKRKN